MNLRFTARLTNTLIALAVLLVAVSTSRAQTRGAQFSDMLRNASPRAMYTQARTNWTEGRFYSTDLQGPGPGGTHPTWQAALKASVQPVNMGANVRAAVMSRIHPFKILGNLVDPVGVELQRQIAAGNGLDFKRLATTLHPTMILTTMAAGTVGDITGAVVQSSLARLGPVGAAAGFFARPMLGFAGTIFGMNVGENMIQGGTFKEAMAQSLRSIKPGRDMGQMMGGVIGGTIGQVLIPIPIVGGIVGGMVGGTIGTLIGSKLSGVFPFNIAERGITSWLNRLADRIEGKDKKKPAAPAPAPEPEIVPPPTGGDNAPALGPTLAASTPARPDARPRPVPLNAFPNPLDGSEPSMDDLRVAAR